MMKRLFSLFYILFLLVFVPSLQAGLVIGSGISGEGVCTGNYGITTENGTNATETYSGMMRALLINVNCGGGTITSISMYLKNCHDSSHEVIFCLYDDDSDSPNNLLYQSAATSDAATNGAYAWVTVTGVNEVITSNTTKIWVAVQFESEGGSGYQYYSVTDARYENRTWNSIPDPWTGDAATSRDIGAYVTFTGSGISAPTVTTQAVDNIHDNNATGHGTITATGGENCSKRGICWGTAPMPTTSDSKAEDSGSFGTGAFSKTISPTIAATKYYVRAYALNSAGTSYGDQVDFTTTGTPPPGCSCYVDTGGDDGTGNGTSGNPWLTVVHALSQSGFGSTVCVNDGTYNESQMVVPVGVSLISTSVNASKVTIQPNVTMGLDIPFVKLETASPGSGGNQAISYLTFDGNTGTYTCRWGFSVKNRNNVTITHCDIKDFTGELKSFGIYVRSSEVDYGGNWQDYWPADPQAPGTETNINALWPANPVEDFELSYCTITNCGYRSSLSSGIRYAAVRPFHLKDSSIHHNTINTEDSLSQPIKAVCALLDNVDIYNNDLAMPYYTDTASWTIELWVHRRSCEFYNNTSDESFSITVGKETKIHDNTITISRTRTFGAGIEFILQTEGEIYSNYIEGSNGYGIVLGLAEHSGSQSWVVRNIKIYNNIIYNAYSSSIFVQNRNHNSGDYTVENIEIYNNTCDDLTRSHISSGLIDVRSQVIEGGGSVTMDNIKIKNNICVNAPGYAGKTLGTVTNLSIEYNLFYGNNTNDWSGSTDTNSVIDNPDISGTGGKPGPWYYLQAVSPCIDNGTNSVNGIVTDDYWGTARDANIDIGAHEYVP